MAFAPLIEQAGVHGAERIALATATAGIVCGSILGAPIATLLMERFHIQPRPPTAAAGTTADVAREEKSARRAARANASTPT